eukprot:CAMPEP_0174742108 /NCGR_PEP_ID=MMETSP1094-20130205/78044_1 /TAXON_ID=156173 /ORGANISM="Chrysochromulina brevifilum, Strain UTEX LB 985" /LENGTH=108 /DNA_ID=CAMNT_0015946113 /DNA_START=353 /DNA_END=676 /DNA_ORIENTATION=-
MSASCAAETRSYSATTSPWAATTSQWAATFGSEGRLQGCARLSHALGQWKERAWQMKRCLARISLCIIMQGRDFVGCGSSLLVRLLAGNVGSFVGHDGDWLAARWAAA